jgi:hypothetical protein
VKESTWEECIESNSSLKVTPDRGKAKSLVETSNGRLDYLQESTIKESNANYVFEGYYSSALELLHALVLLEGYKVSNHICLGFFLRDILDKNDLFRLFDDCRFKRISLLYYGKKMDFETAKEAIERCISLIKELSLLVKF